MPGSQASPLQPFQPEPPEPSQPPAPPPEPPAGDPVAGDQFVEEESVDGSAAVLAEVTPEHISQFSTELESAIAGGFITPKKFAEGFIERVGPETVAAIIQAVGPDQLVDAVAATDGSANTAIVTREGRKYVNELWVQAAEILGLA